MTNAARSAIVCAAGFILLAAGVVFVSVGTHSSTADAPTNPRIVTSSALAQQSKVCGVNVNEESRVRRFFARLFGTRDADEPEIDCKLSQSFRCCRSV